MQYWSVQMQENTRLRRETQLISGSKMFLNCRTRRSIEQIVCNSGLLNKRIPTQGRKNAERSYTALNEDGK